MAVRYYAIKLDLTLNTFRALAKSGRVDHEVVEMLGRELDVCFALATSDEV